MSTVDFAERKTIEPTPLDKKSFFYNPSPKQTQFPMFAPSDIGITSELFSVPQFFSNELLSTFQNLTKNPPKELEQLIVNPKNTHTMREIGQLRYKVFDYAGIKSVLNDSQDFPKGLDEHDSYSIIFATMNDKNNINGSIRVIPPTDNGILPIQSIANTLYGTQNNSLQKLINCAIKKKEGYVEIGRAAVDKDLIFDSTQKPFKQLLGGILTIINELSSIGVNHYIVGVSEDDYKKRYKCLEPNVVDKIYNESCGHKTYFLDFYVPNSQPCLKKKLDNRCK